MKQLTLLFLIFGITYAQIQFEARPFEYDLSPIATGDSALSQYLDRATEFICYGITDDYGCVFGTGWDGESDKMYSFGVGMHYDGVENAIVKQVIIKFFKADVIGTADEVSVNIYKIDQDSVPTDKIGSATLSTEDIIVNNWTTFVISDNADTDGEPFVVSVEWDHQPMIRWEF